MLKSELKYNKKNKLIIVQKIQLECDECHREYEIGDVRIYLAQIKRINKNLCFNCSRPRGENHPSRLYGISRETAKKISDSNRGKKKNMSAENRIIAANRIRDYNVAVKGKTLEERLGEEKAKHVRELRSKNASGENNPMYGKPAPIGSGAGVQGWYKGWFFRSLKELSFMVNHIEKNNLPWRQGDTKDYRIPYLFNGRKRTYFPDFIIEHKVIEIKPEFWKNNSEINDAKFEAANEWCKRNRYTYRVFTENDFDQLTLEEIKTLIAQGIITFRRGTKRVKVRGSLIEISRGG
jgi:hypothetical protein